MQSNSNNNAGYLCLKNSAGEFECTQEFSVKKKAKKIVFYPSSDTLAYLLVPVIKSLQNKYQNEECELEVWLPNENNENSDIVIGKEVSQIKIREFSFSVLFTKRPDIIVFGNDWASDSKQIIAWSRWLNIETVCIQESVIDFNESDKRMKFADFVLVQGLQTLKHLNRNQIQVVGNPRYESLVFTQRKSFQRTLVNVNFTYGVFEASRADWLGDVVSTSDSLGVPFQISQHPRDTGDLSYFGDKLINSNAGSIHSQLAQNDILITRFSSLIHEAIAMGLKVIYYNPHQESMVYDFQPDNKVLFMANSPAELTDALNYITTLRHEEDSKLYMQNHFRPFSENPSDVIGEWLLSERQHRRTGEKIGFKYLVIRPVIKYIASLLIRAKLSLFSKR